MLWKFIALCMISVDERNEAEISMIDHLKVNEIIRNQCYSESHLNSPLLRGNTESTYWH